MEKSFNEEIKVSIHLIKHTLDRIEDELVKRNDRLSNLMSRVSIIEERLDKKLADRTKLQNHLARLNERLKFLENKWRE